MNAKHKSYMSMNHFLYWDPIRQEHPKAMVKYMLYPNIVDLINLNMSWMKAAVNCAFKHW